MSSKSSDPTNLNRDFDSNSLASASADSSEPSQAKKKKSWSKFKSSIKSLGEKMSSRPKLPEQAEGGEQKRSKKNKKSKNSRSSGEVKPSPQEEEKEKLNVESSAPPYVGSHPKSVTSTMTYAKALTKSGSTSESNLSTSDKDSPRKVLVLDKSIPAQESPDSGRVSQDVEGREAYSDFSVDSDYTLGSQRTAVSSLDIAGLDAIKDKITDITVELIKAETKLETPELVSEASSSDYLKSGGTEEVLKKKSRDQENENKYETKESRSNRTLIFSSDKNASADLIKSEKSIGSIQPTKYKEGSLPVDKLETSECPKPSDQSSSEIPIKQPDTYENDSKDIKITIKEQKKHKTYNKQVDTTEAHKSADLNSGSNNNSNAKSDTKEHLPSDTLSTNTGTVKLVSLNSKEEDNQAPNPRESGDTLNISPKAEVHKNEKDITDSKENISEEITIKIIETKRANNSNKTSHIAEGSKSKDLYSGTTNRSNTMPGIKEVSPSSTPRTSNDAGIVVSSTPNSEDKQDPKSIENYGPLKNSSKPKVGENEEKRTSVAKETPESLREENEPPNVLMSSSKATEDVPQNSELSVEEKLEAFLSSEGWSGTIKDTAGRAGADGVSQMTCIHINYSWCFKLVV